MGAKAKGTVVTSSLLTPTTYLSRCEPLTQGCPRRKGDSEFPVTACVSPEEKGSGSRGSATASTSSPAPCVKGLPKAPQARCLAPLSPPPTFQLNSMDTSKQVRCAKGRAPCRTVRALRDLKGGAKTKSHASVCPSARERRHHGKSGLCVRRKMSPCFTELSETGLRGEIRFQGKSL